ncbi:MAG: hypothetical protein ACOX3U_00865 [Christensenellales bacterium]
MVNEFRLKVEHADLGYELAKANEKFMMDKLKALDEAYKAVKANRLENYIKSLPESLNLEKVIYNAPSDDKLKQKAESMLCSEYLDGHQKIIQNIDNTRKSLLGRKESLSEDQQSVLKALDEKYEQIKESIGNEVLKRGVGRSSIAVNRITDAALLRAEQAGVIESETRKEINAIENKIIELNKEKEDSVRAFDLAHAVKVQKELDKLIAERDKKAKEVIEYNNKVEKQETDYIADRAEKISDYEDKIKREGIQDEEYFNKYGYYPSMKQEYEERYKVAFDFYDKLETETAKRVLNNNRELEKYLGPVYYNKLRTAILMRK